MKSLRKAIAVVALAPALVLGACVGSSNNTAADENNTLRITLATHIWTDSIKEALPQFEKKTGIKVEVNELGEDKLSAHYMVKLNAGNRGLDVMMYRPLQEGKTFASNGWLEDITKKAKSDTKWDWNDFQEGPAELTTYDGAVVGVPIITEREILYYRKDLLQKSGFNAPPKTLDELKTMALKIKQDNPGIGGFVARTNPSAAITMFSSFLYAYGADFDKDGKSMINSPEAKAAYEMYSSLLRDAGSDNLSTDMGWPEAMELFTSGKAAFYAEADALYKNATNPEKSQITDTVSFAPFPEGPAGHHATNVPPWALGINVSSPHKDAAWKFIRWATGKEMSLKLQQQGNPCARQSVWDNPSATANDPTDLAAASKGSAEGGVGHDRPLVVDVGRARNIVGQPIADGIAGKDVNQSADAAHEAYQKFLDSEA